MEEYLELLAEISIPHDYDPLSRYKDFRQVFLNSEEGRRVLRQILNWGNVLKPHPAGRPIDSATTERMEGGRALALLIFSVMLAEPPKKPDETTKRPRKEH